MRESCRWLNWMKDAAFCCITWWALVSLSDDTCQLQLAERTSSSSGLETSSPVRLDHDDSDN